MPAVIYLSRAEENLINGTYQMLSQGNTQIVAEKIATKVNGKLYGIEPIDSYPKQYLEAVEKAKLEKEEGILPCIKEIHPHIYTESTLFLGYPNWWGGYPQAMATFLATVSIAGKVIYPFCTHEGSSFGHSLEELRRTCPKAIIKPGLAVRGSRVFRSDQAIENWLKYYYF